MLDYHIVRHWPFADVAHCYAERDTLLYALGLGLGADPLDPAQLRFVTETELHALPSMATVLAWSTGWMQDPRTGIDYVRTVHGEHDVTLLAPLPAQGEVVGRTHVSRVCDKGAGKGAIVESVRELFLPGGQPLAVVRQINFCRGDGGYSASGGVSDAAPQSLPAVPDHAPDCVASQATLPQAALIYRLSGDWNPLHSEPAVAARAGFVRPILHGLCTWGMAAYAVLRTCCNNDASRLRRMAARFSAPVYPGETLEFQIWRASDAQGAHLRASVPARNAIVLDHGWFEFN
jgi:acyl dehydratase